MSIFQFLFYIFDFYFFSSNKRLDKFYALNTIFFSVESKRFMTRKENSLSNILYLYFVYLALSVFCGISLCSIRCSVSLTNTDNPLIRLVSRSWSPSASGYNCKNVGAQCNLEQLGNPSKILASSRNSPPIPFTF